MTTVRAPATWKARRSPNTPSPADLNQPVAIAADNVGWEPPQPIESAPEGRLFRATFSSSGRQSTSRPDYLSAQFGVGPRHDMAWRAHSDGKTAMGSMKS